MKKVYLFLTVFVAVGLFACTAYSQPSAEDFGFTPPARGGTTEVENPSKVKIDVKNNIIVAETFQDAFNAGEEESVKAVSKKGIPDVEKKETIIKKRDFNPNLQNCGAWICGTGSGLGFMATGCASYGQYDNDESTLVSQRKAYMVAFMEAKGNLTALQRKINIEGSGKIASKVGTLYKASGSKGTTMDTWEEQIKSSVEGILRGHVVYEVKDEVSKDHGNIFVTIVSTPKTQGKLSRVASDKCETTQSLRDGINELITEVSQGLVPPIGGLCLAVPGTDELAFIGFGSVIVKQHDDGLAQSQFAKAAMNIAKLKATRAVLTIIHEEKIEVIEDYANEGEEGLLNLSEESDPINQDNTKEVRHFSDNTAYKRFVESQVKGTTPAGINTKVWFNEDQTWAIAMAVYTPSATRSVRNAVSEIDSQSILERDEAQLSEQEKSSKGGKTSATGTKKPKAEIKQGPTGKFYNSPDDL